MREQDPPVTERPLIIHRNREPHQWSVGHLLTYALVTQIRVTWRKVRRR